MKREEHRHTIIPRVEPLPKEPPKPCMRGVLDIDLYNRTGEVKYIEPLAEFLPPENVEDDVEVDRMVKGRMRILNPNKPKKEALERDLRSGMSIAEVGKKYDTSKAVAYNWITAYGLRGVKGKSKAEDDKTPAEKDMVQEPAPDDMVQESPTLAEVEQFYTDNPVQELPKVEFEGPMLDMDEEEWKSQNFALPKPFEEVWQGIADDLAALQRTYVAEANRAFSERLRKMFTEVMGVS